MNDGLVTVAVPGPATGVPSTRTLSLAARFAVATTEHELPVGFEVDGGETVNVTWFEPPADGNESDWVDAFGVVGSPTQLISTFDVALAGIIPNGNTATPIFAGPEPDEALGSPATPSLVPPVLFPVEVVDLAEVRLRQRNNEPDFEQISFVVFFPSSFLLHRPLSFAVEASAGSAKLSVAAPNASAANAALVVFALGGVLRVRRSDDAGSVIEMVLSVVRASGYARRAGHRPRKPELTSGWFGLSGIPFTYLGTLPQGGLVNHAGW